jgi:hypothetical protein
MRINQFTIFVIFCSIAILVAALFSSVFEAPLEKTCIPVLYTQIDGGGDSSGGGDFGDASDNPVAACELPCKQKCLQVTDAPCEKVIGGGLIGDISTGENLGFRCKCQLPSKKRNYQEDCI